MPEEQGTQYSLHTADTREQGIALGWEDIQHLEQGTVTKASTEDTLPDGPHERTVEYVAPFFKPDREADYRIAGAFLSPGSSTDKPKTSGRVRNQLIPYPWPGIGGKAGRYSLLSFAAFSGFFANCIAGTVTFGRFMRMHWLIRYSRQ